MVWHIIVVQCSGDLEAAGVFCVTTFTAIGKGKKMRLHKELCCALSLRLL